MDLKLLCAADLHLGRRPSRLPESRTGGAVSSATGWENLVAHAVSEDVDAVLLGGDVIDEFNRSFEAYGPLERGVGRLAEADIPVVAVAGNHDHDTLPDVASEIGDRKLVVLGRGGEWERWSLRGPDGRARMHVDGWSFPRRHVPSSPVLEYVCEPSDGAPIVGLLHCELDVAESRYAPVRSADLRSHSVAAWILGHVHAPGLRNDAGSVPLLYPGSLQALDPGEEGSRGAWMLRIGRDRAPVFTRVPLSATHYSTVEVDVEGLDESGAINARIRGALTAHLQSLAEHDEGCLRVAHCRVRLVGRTPLHSRLGEIARGLVDFDPAVTTGPRLVVDPRLVIDTRPAMDLESLARADDAAGLLARVLLSLDSPSDRVPDRDLLSRASEVATAVG